MVTVELAAVPGRRGVARLTVTDNAPEGFQDLREAFTLFASSRKKADPTQRGRFNLGEKLVLALCEWAEVVSTTGAVRFDQAGRHRLRRTTGRGTVFTALIRFDQADLAATEQAVRTVLPPPGIETLVNGQPLPYRAPLRTFTAALPTEIADAEGYLRPTRRRTTVAIYNPGEGETPSLYELGIPVVATSDRWHVDIRQKIPLTTDRDNITPAYLRLVRTLVANHTADLITKQDATSTWIQEALADERVEPVVVEQALTELFGAKRVAYDPSDREANKLATAEGYTVVHGGTFSAPQWDNIRRAGALKPAGHVTPSPKVLTSPDGKPPIPRDQWTPAMRRLASYTQRLGLELLGFEPTVEFQDLGNKHQAWWGNRTITFNLRQLGRHWPDSASQEAVDALLLHEFAHDREADHLDRALVDEVARLGARLRWSAETLLDDPRKARLAARSRSRDHAESLD